MCLTLFQYYTLKPPYFCLQFWLHSSCQKKLKVLSKKKVVDGIGVEKVFPLYSPLIDKIEIVRRSKVRRAKLYYIREKVAREIKRQMRKMHFMGVSTESDIEVAARAEEEAKRAEEEAAKKAEEEAKKAEEEKAATEASAEEEKKEEEQTDAVEEEKKD